MVEIVTAAGIIKVGAAAAVPDCFKIDVVTVPVDAAATVLGCSRIITAEIRNEMGDVLFKLCDCDIEQNNIFKAREEKYQSRINALETLAAGATEENKICDLVAVARFLIATLIIPEIQESTRSKGIRRSDGKEKKK
ncbi:uncharacterized protein LOC107489016 isoform X3 [Arachis duranensis]|uniref:Uncharacterized protein LOC107489016 isoform X3 n=1 Tax=Arachis duranensis TaxID=130453 RepID=A0A9C6TY62_ARADU|nr:uncharacterized protein LOC107489016 isoform X3 [Arachis duranensis]